jgi:hypothetical protein
MDQPLWAQFVSGAEATNVIPLRQARPWTKQPAQRLNAEGREIVAALERSYGRPLTPEEINLSLEQARALGEIADNVVPIKRGAA